MNRRVCARRFARRRWPSILMLCWLCAALSPALAADPLVIDADTQFSYADALFERGAFDPAIVEFERFVNFFPTDERVARALLAIGQSHFEQRRFAAARAACARLIDRHSPNEIAVRAYFLISRCHAAEGAFGAAVLNLKNLLAVADDPAVRDEALYRTAWLHIETGAWEPARAAFARISPAGRDRFDLDAVETRLAAADTLPRKNPTAAGLLGIVPGGGFLYCERYQDALTAFFLNGALIWAALEAFDNDLEALGTVIAFVEFGFYAGSIYGGVASAHKANRRQTRNFIERLKQETRLSLGIDAEGRPALALRWRF